ncbi:MAG: DUF2061 domain-containing protein [Deltaproteobacteria bacterium]|nr:DUF2061 domain-containing protein [Deltaproteobacteria bacterium]
MIRPMWVGMLETGSWARSVAKALSYRVLGSLATLTIAYLTTKDFKISAGIAITEFITKLGFYVAHERIWGFFRK